MCHRGLVAEERCTGNARHAFFELQGLKYEATERYVGKTDRAGISDSLYTVVKFT